MKPGNAILSSYSTTVFEVMSQLAQSHQAVNLGQGFPDGNGPEDVVAAAAAYLHDGVNQYLVEICSVDREMRMLVTGEPAAWLRENGLAVPVKIGKFPSFDTVAL